MTLRNIPRIVFRAEKSAHVHIAQDSARRGRADSRHAREKAGYGGGNP